MCAEMNMIWLHVEASNLKLSGWVWSPCSQERTEKSYHASSLFRLAPPHPLPPLADHLLQVYPLLRVAFSWSQGHLSSFIVFWQLGMWSWQAFLFVVGCPMVPTSKSLWVPGSKKKNIQEFFSYVRHWLFQHLSSRPLAVPLPCSLLKPLSVSSYWVIPFIQRVRLPYWQAWVKIVLQPQGTGSFELSDSQNTWCE